MCWSTLVFVDLRWLAGACVGHRGPVLGVVDSLAFVGLRLPALVVVGLRSCCGPAMLAFIGSLRPALARVGCREPVQVELVEMAVVTWQGSCVYYICK